MILVNSVPNLKSVAPKLQKLSNRKVPINVGLRNNNINIKRHQSGKTYSLVEMKFRRDKKHRTNRFARSEQQRQDSHSIDWWDLEFSLGGHSDGILSFLLKVKRQLAGIVRNVSSWFHAYHFMANMGIDNWAFRVVQGRFFSLIKICQLFCFQMHTRN